MDRSRRRPGVLLSPTPARLTLSPPPLHGVALRFPEPWLSHIAPHIHVHEEEASAPGESCRPITTAALAHAPWDTLLDTHAGRISEHVLSKSPFYSELSSCCCFFFFLSLFKFLVVPCSVPESGRSPGEGHGNPVQYSFMQNRTDRGAWCPTVPRVAESWT